jgi:hypothetical protein
MEQSIGEDQNSQNICNNQKANQSLLQNTTHLEDLKIYKIVKNIWYTMLEILLHRCIDLSKS